MKKIILQYLLISIVLTQCDPNQAAIQFTQKQISEPLPAYSENPYEINDPTYIEAVEEALSDNHTVCAIKYLDDSKITYELETFASKEEAEQNQFIVTHQGKCGACSTLQDLAVYLTTDLTRPVRQCGLTHFLSQKKLEKCIKDLGFTDTCTQIWLYNTLFTKKQCFYPCMKSFLLREKFVKPDGSLNKCLQCDEDNSGPIFKYESGRTRRNSGIKSEIDRPSDQIYNITHCYY